MRIRRKIQLAGLAVVLASGVSGTAEAGDVTVSTATTTPLVTSNPDGSATPGDVTVTSSGSIAVGAGQTAITVDSNNDVSTAGVLSSEDDDNSTGISIIGGNSGNITNTGTISLVETFTLTDTDSDGDLDGNFAVGTNRHGIFLQAGPTFTGNITSSGTITVEGNNSSGITIDGLLTGILDVTGTINVAGDNSAGIAINGGVTGDVLAHGPIVARGENSTGLSVTGDIGGELSISSTWTVTGYHSTVAPSDESTLEPEDLEQAGSAIYIASNVAGGVTLEGIGVENDEDDDDDGELNEADDNVGASITQAGSAPAMHVIADGANITLGAGASGYGITMRGMMQAVSVFEGLSATGIRIEGDGLGNTATVTGGVLIDNSITVAAREADAQALVVGQDGIVPQINIRGTIVTNVASDTAQTAYGVLIDSGASVTALTNSGSITANYFGETGDAAVITDRSGTLTSITNSGTIAANVVATDDDLTDDVPPPPITGSAIAIDVSTSGANVTLQQIAPTVFTDDDATDNIVAGDPSITGDILFGTGNDTIDLLDGSITGDVSFGAGADVFNINNGAVFTGQLSDADGQLTLNVVNGELNAMGGTLNITSASFGADATLRVLLSDVPAETTFIQSSGAITFTAGAEVRPVVPAGLPEFGTLVFLTANGGLFGASNVTGPLTGTNTPFLYNISIDVTNPLAADGDPNSLEANFDLKTAAELGLSANQSTAFLPIIDALRLDDAAAAAMAGITTEYEFFDAYEDLMPNYGPGATEIAATAITQMQSATSNRMAATRMQDLEEVSVWGQEIAYGLTREAPSTNSQEFRGQGFGFAFGIDGPTDSGNLFGLSASFIASEVEEPGRPDGEISAWFGQLNAYYATAFGPIDLDIIAGAGAGKMESRRFVEIGNPIAFSALTEADWMAYEGHGSVRASAPLSAGWFVMTPQVALTYLGLNEEGYEESGGGAAVDYIVEDVFSQRLYGDAGVEFATNWNLGRNSVVSPRLYVGYRTNLIDEEAERTVQFVSGGSPFTLTDEGVGEGGPVVGFGFDATNGYSTFSLGYEGEFGDQIERHSLNAAIRFRF
jgi:uncharacterized protein with beta-barrel porin domain